MKKLSADVCAVTHAGRVRRENEDNYSLNGKLTSTGELKKGSAYVQHMAEPFHIAVCDGMGGESFGEIASGIAIEEIANNASKVFNSGDDFSFAISSTLNDANEKICNEINARGTRMGTTLASVYVSKGKAICVSMGDTRIYHFSNGILEQMSFDHTHAQGFVDAMAVSADNISSIPDAKRLTKHLGVFPEEASLQPNISVIDDVDNGDIILLCSDGLTDMISDDEISAILANGESARDITGKLIKKALEKGGKDNVTVVTAFMEAQDTAIFVPIAEAMVGNEDPDYSEEYRNSITPVSENDNGDVPVSPYANADARAYEKPADKIKILKTVAIAIVVLAVLAIAALIIKGALGKTEEETTTEISATEFTYVISTTEPEISTWNIDDETSTTESTTEETTESTTQETTTTKRYYSTTTRRYTTTTKRVTTTKKVTTAASTTKKETTTKSAETSSSTEPTASTSKVDESSTSKQDTSNTSTSSSESSSSATSSSATSSTSVSETSSVSTSASETSSSSTTSTTQSQSN